MSIRGILEWAGCLFYSCTKPWKKKKKVSAFKFKALLNCECLQRGQRLEASERIRSQGVDFVVAQISGK